MIVFVGDRPGKKNIDPSIPFVGTQSYRRLLEWVWKMDLSINDVKILNQTGLEYNYVTGAVFDNLNFLGRSSEIKFVALGNNASDKLEEIGLNHWMLPHPSGRNRKLNDKKWLNKELKECGVWLRQD